MGCCTQLTTPQPYCFLRECLNCCDPRKKNKPGFVVSNHALQQKRLQTSSVKRQTELLLLSIVNAIHPRREANQINNNCRFQAFEIKFKEVKASHCQDEQGVDHYSLVNIYLISSDYAIKSAQHRPGQLSEDRLTLLSRVDACGAINTLQIYFYLIEAGTKSNHNTAYQSALPIPIFLLCLARLLLFVCFLCKVFL